MRIHCVSSHSKDSLSVVVFWYMLMCLLLWFSCQYLPTDWLERPSEDTLTWWDYLHKAQVEEIVCMYSFFHLICLCCCVFPPRPTQYIFDTPMAWYSLFVLKMPLNTNKPHQTCRPTWPDLIPVWFVGDVKRTSGTTADQAGFPDGLSKENIWELFKQNFLMGGFAYRPNNRVRRLKDGELFLHCMWT